MESTSAAVGAHPLDRQIRLTLQVALLIFSYTIVIGILNGLDLVEFSRTQLLSHLHGGTLGWMTLAILGVTQWLFGGSAPLSEASARLARRLTILACAAIALYVGAFATTTGAVRPLAGVATLIALTGFAAWAYARARQMTLTVPRLLVLLGLTSSVIGGAFGVLNGLAIAFDWRWVPETFFEAHPGTMEVGFVMPVAMGLAEWGLRRHLPDERPTRAGWAQAALMFIAFAWVLGFILADVEELIGPGVTFAIAAIVIFSVRNWSVARQVSLVARRPERHALMGGLLLGVTIVYIFVIITAAEGDFTAIPRGQMLAFIHLLGVGATTNALLAFTVFLSRRATATGWADDVVFWGVNAGVIGFAVSLTIDVRGLIFLFVPVMGLALLLAIVVHVRALRTAPDQPAALPA